MQTVQLDIQDDKFQAFLTIIKNLKDDMIKDIRTSDAILDIESIKIDSQDYLDMQNIKKEQNPKYSLQEAKELLGL
ncbi:MAG: hypothetical protein IBX44_00595 [Sulfurospirillum sp.]|nr:hypothetical protein [Sulfurospirillum sp.]